MNDDRIYPLRGVIQHYQWGGTDFLPNLLLKENNNNEPWAEYWLGVHPKGTAQVKTETGWTDLSVLLEQQPELVGPEVNPEFGALPFLLKILDVREMLSIQLHPSREVAASGFAKEEAAGIPRLAADRNYKDKNHKPEVMVALSDFWLLHGFKTREAIATSLQRVPAWQSLIPVLEQHGVPGLYEKVMNSSDEEIFSLLDPWYKKLRASKADLQPDHPDYWAWQAFLQYSEPGRHDRGIFSVYWFNLVRLAAGEGIFQAAGIPHAYLRGINVELMANSDNVLRGGLTPKHVDVPELLVNMDFSPVTPQVLKGSAVGEQQFNYPVPVADFTLDRYELAAGDTLQVNNNGPAIFLLTEGSLRVKNVNFHRGEAFFVPANTEITGTNKDGKQAEIFRAGVD